MGLDVGDIDLTVNGSMNIGLPKIEIVMNPVTVNPVTINPLTLHLDPMDISMRLKEIPSVRAHLPTNYSVGLSFFGVEMMCMRLFGESQVITEPYIPNACEECGRIHEGASARPVAVEVSPRESP